MTDHVHDILNEKKRDVNYCKYDKINKNKNNNINNNDNKNNCNNNNNRNNKIKNNNSPVVRRRNVESRPVAIDDESPTKESGRGCGDRLSSKTPPGCDRNAVLGPSDLGDEWRRRLRNAEKPQRKSRRRHQRHHLGRLDRPLWRSCEEERARETRAWGGEVAGSGRG